MSPETIRQRLRELLRTVRLQAAHDSLSADADFIQGLALDSLDVGNFLMEVETEFDVQLGLEGFAELRTLDLLSEFIVRSQLLNGETDSGLDDAASAGRRLAAHGGSR
jgi:acyl carrier protein